MLGGKVTYSELQNSPEGIPTNILADRLKRLEEAGLVAKSAYQQHPVRYAYELTEKGKALGDVLLLATLLPERSIQLTGFGFR